VSLITKTKLGLSAGRRTAAALPWPATSTQQQAASQAAAPTRLQSASQQHRPASSRRPKGTSVIK